MRTPWRRLASVALTTAVLAGSVGLLPAGAASPAAETAAPATASAAAPARQAKPRAAKYIPVWVKIGGRVAVRDARVTAIDSHGKVLARTKTGPRGTAFFKRSDLKAKFSIRVNGGFTSHGLALSEPLSAPVVLAQEPGVIFVSPVTTFAHEMSHRKKISYEDALRIVKRQLGIPQWTRPTHFTGVSTVFNPRAYERLLKAKAPRSAGSMLERTAAAVRSTSAPREVATSTGGLAMAMATAAVEAIGWNGATAILGKFLPQGPSNAQLGKQLGQISDQLSDISTQLTQIENDTQDILKQLGKSQYNGAYNYISDIVDATGPLWDKYQWIANTGTCPYNVDPATCTVPSDYLSSVADAVTSFCGLASLGNAMLPFAKWGSLFDNQSGAIGVLDALYEMYRSQDNAYWTPDDVATIFQAVDYYGTLQMQGAILLNEAWTYPGSTCARPQSSVTFDMDNYVVQNNYIRANLPSAVPDNSIIAPPTTTSTADTTSETVYQMVWKQFEGAVSGQYLKGDNPTCSKSGTNVPASSWSTYFYGLPLVSASSVTNGWQSVVPAGFNIMHASDLPGVKSLFMSKRDGLTALQAMHAGATAAWIAVTAEALPVASTDYARSMNSSAYKSYPAGLMWCNGTVLGLSNGEDATWTQDFLMWNDAGTAEHYPSNSSIGYSIGSDFTTNTGVLVSDKIKLHYVDPYVGAPAPPAAPTDPPCDPSTEDCVGDDIADAEPFPGGAQCSALYGVCGAGTNGTEMLNDYNDHDVYQIDDVASGEYMIFESSDFGVLNFCTYCGLTVYDQALQAVLTCPTVAACLDNQGDPVYFEAPTAGTYYIDVHRGGDLPYPTNSAYDVQVVWIPQ